MKLDFSGFKMKKSYEQVRRDCSLTVWGEYYQDMLLIIKDHRKK